MCCLVLADRSGPVYDRVEAVVLIGGVVHGANGTIRLHQCVLAWNEHRLHLMGFFLIDKKKQ